MKTILLIVLVLCITWCISPEIDQQELIKQQEIQKKINEKELEERRILEEERVKLKIIRAKEIEQEERAKNNLLGNDLLEETALLNKQALNVLNSEVTLVKDDQEFDIHTDNSLTRFVNNTTPYNDLEYIPQNLVSLEWEYTKDVKWWAKLRQEAADALDNLAQNYFLRFGIPLDIVSTYRSYEYQKWIKDRGCDDTLCAKAWYSEHQSGLAVDFWEASEESRFRENEDLKMYFEWMKQEAYKFWFTNTYQKGLEIDWYWIEPWHWRYVGEDLALILKEYKITFAEYIRSPESY